MPLRIIPVSLATANAFVLAHHRHHGPTVGHKWSIGCLDDGQLCGVAIMGHPVARRADDGWTLEVTRVATNGTRNACSALYGACRRAAQALGFAKIITYTLLEEQGASLRGAGWTEEAISPGGEWSCTSRPRCIRPARQAQPKHRWSCILAPVPAWSPEAHTAQQIGQASLWDDPA